MKLIEGFQYSMGTVFWHSRVDWQVQEWLHKCNTWRNKMLMTPLNRSVPWFWKIDEWLSTKWQFVCKLVLVFLVNHNRLNFQRLRDGSQNFIRPSICYRPRSEERVCLCLYQQKKDFIHAGFLFVKIIKTTNILSLCELI